MYTTEALIQIVQIKSGDIIFIKFSFLFKIIKRLKKDGTV